MFNDFTKSGVIVFNSNYCWAKLVNLMLANTDSNINRNTLCAVFVFNDLLYFGIVLHIYVNQNLLTKYKNTIHQILEFDIINHV